MRIYLYLRIFPGTGAPLTNGMHKAVHGLASGLASAGARVTVLCEANDAAHTQMPDGYDIRCFACDPTIGHKATFKLSPSLITFVEKEMEPGLTVLNGIFNTSVGALARLLHKKNIPFVVAPHDPYHPEIFSKNKLKKFIYWRMFERPMLRNAEAVQVLDVRHAQYLRDLKVDTPVIPLPNGFLPAEASHAATPLDGGEPRFIFLGRMDAHNKGLDLLLEAFAQLDANSGAKLTLQGPVTADRALLEQQADSLHLQNRAQFLNPDYSRPSSAVVSDHHVFCLPSRFEGFGLAALEAMLAGRPVLVSDVGGIAPHVKASGGGVVVHADVDSIRDGLKEMLKRRGEWAQMGQRGREYVLQHLKWETIGASALEQYSKLIVGPLGRLEKPTGLAPHREPAVNRT